VPKSNRDQQKKKIPKKNYSPHHLSFFFKKLRWFGRNPKRRCRGGLGKTLGEGAEVVWPTKKVAKGFGSGRLDFGDRFCWRKKWFIDKQ
jgi:hypothetical protein